VLGHEVGHHVCGHTVGVNATRPWEKELEADSVAGNIVRNMEQAAADGNVWASVSLDEIIAAANAIYSEQGSPTHPPRHMRIAAVLDGYHKGHQCAGR
jgi:hypothetical protein